MAAKKGNSSKKRNSAGRSSRSQAAKERQKEEEFRQEIILWVIVAISLVLFISNFGVGGAVGSALSGILFGLFGLLAYVFPVVLLIGSFFVVSNRGNRFATMKMVATVLLVVFLCTLMALFADTDEILSPSQSYVYSYQTKLGGGVIGGTIAYGLGSAFGMIGAYIIDVVVLIVSVVLLTERSALKGMQAGGRRMFETAREDRAYRREQIQERRSYGNPEEEDDRQVSQERRPRRMDQKVSGVASDTRIGGRNSSRKAKKSDEMKEIPFTPEFAEPADTKQDELFIPEPVIYEPEPIADEILPDSVFAQKELEEPEVSSVTKVKTSTSGIEELVTTELEVEKKAPAKKPRASEKEVEQGIEEVAMQIAAEDSVPQKEYIYPPVNLLKQSKLKKSGNTQNQLRETAMKLQQTLKTFGVNVTVTDISCGPAVTRYEIQPEMGVKVSKIVNLADDIKLNLAAADIRIEAPIPGKAAVGIEVPNSENVMVSFRELIESKEFQEARSKICFAVGRDIAGNVKVADIAKMPHVLIAGATGSGKSVCINTIIMSILYKADPSEVKLIMIDPKVVELSVYNGIPHLMIPVVTDPKKAAGALNWAVQEMTDRYQKFAEASVRKFEEYNAKVDKIEVPEGQEPPKKMAQIVIIVDELADLMMVASHEVEDAICRLAQLARAAGIHLVIATQRPSVNVITGLIKANMPSRIAFAVTSGIDSRTILDMNGAEKLLGKGDMLFNPQGIPKPLRVQGAFVSDEEVSDVVSFIKESNGAANYSLDVQQKMENLENSGNTTVAISDGDAGDGRDFYFADAGKIVVDKEKASIGMLQRYLKVGFNRAARIMDQLEEAGVVGPEEGTKPRKVLMNPEEFQQLVDGL